jgi:hypothetical protein
MLLIRYIHRTIHPELSLQRCVALLNENDLLFPESNNCHWRTGKPLRKYQYCWKLEPSFGSPHIKPIHNGAEALPGEQHTVQVIVILLIHVDYFAKCGEVECF